MLHRLVAAMLVLLPAGAAFGQEFPTPEEVAELARQEPAPFFSMPVSFTLRGALPGGETVEGGRELADHYSGLLGGQVEPGLRFGWVYLGALGRRSFGFVPEGGCAAGKGCSGYVDDVGGVLGLYPGGVASPLRLAFGVLYERARVTGEDDAWMEYRGHLFEASVDYGFRLGQGKRPWFLGPSASFGWGGYGSVRTSAGYEGDHARPGGFFWSSLGVKIAYR